MRWNCNKRQQRLQKWHLCFLYLPRKVEGVCVWWEYVWRIGELKHIGHMGEFVWKWDYRLAIQDMSREARILGQKGEKGVNNYDD